MKADRLCVASFLFGVRYRVELGLAHPWNTAHDPYDNQLLLASVELIYSDSHEYVTICRKHLQ